jgi:hypothetical protein
MSLPTVIEEIFPEPEPAKGKQQLKDDDDEVEDLSSAGFERLMREVLEEDEKKDHKEDGDDANNPAC